MPVVNDNTELDCTLPALEDVKVENLDTRFFLKLKSNHNVDEVKNFLTDIGQRLLAYQFAKFYDYELTLPKSAYSVEHEYLQDFDNKEDDCKTSFHRFTFTVKTSITNKYPKKNNGPASLDDVDWVMAMPFISILGLPDVAFINTEDLAFKQKDACFYGRSMVRLFIQNYIQNNKTLVQRNFEVIKASELEGPAKAIIQKQRDLSLSREEAYDHLKAMTSLDTGNDFTAIADDPNFTIWE